MVARIHHAAGEPSFAGGVSEAEQYSRDLSLSASSPLCGAGHTFAQDSYFDFAPVERYSADQQIAIGAFECQ